MIFVQADPHRLRHFDVACITALLIFNPAYRFGDLAGLAMHRPGRPVGSADFIKHGPAYPDARISLETGPLFRIKVSGCLDQPDHAGLYQIIRLYTRG